MILTATEQGALLWFSGLLIAGFLTTSWYVLRKLFDRLSDQDERLRSIELTLARMEGR